MGRLNIKVKNTIKEKDASTSNESKKVYKINFGMKKSSSISNTNTNINKEPEIKENLFKVGDMVQHVEEKIIGEIKFIGSEELSILWNDNSRERFNLNNLKNIVAYVPDLQQRIDPLIDNSSITTTESLTKQDIINRKDVVSEPEIDDLYRSTKENSSELDDLYSKAFEDMEDTYDDIEDANPNKNQINARQNSIKNIKEKAINEIIDTMKLKNLILSDLDEENERKKIAEMNDEEFEQFKNKIIKSNMRKEIVKTEAELMLEKIKSGGAIIGDFSSSISSTSTGSGSGTGARNLSDVKTASKSDYDKDYVGNLSEDGFSLEFGSDFADSLNSTTKEAAKNELKEEPKKLNLENFQNLQGLTRPVQIPAEQRSYKQNITDAIASMDWTTLSKIF